MAQIVSQQKLYDVGLKRLEAYAKQVVLARAVSDYRDGLKPVHRRILWAMHKAGFTYSGKYVKCARIVGDTIGLYHPHGDQSIYDAMVGMIKSSMPLILGQGGFGNHRDGPAAYRYTEAKMSKLADKMVFGGDYIETVPLVPTYDDSGREPVFLPALFPNLLFNGCQGIAYGVAANIPPMHPEPVMKLIRQCLKGETITAQKVMKTLRFNWPNPSTCVTEDEDILGWLMKGKGALHFQPSFEYDERHRTVTFTGIPPNFNYDSIYNRVTEKPWCVDFEDLSDRNMVGAAKIRVKIKGGNEDFETRLKETVKMFTNTFATSTTVVTNGRTLAETTLDKLTIPDFFPMWCAYRVQLERDYQAYRIRQFMKDIDRQNLLLLVIKHLEAVSKVIKTSGQPRPDLMALLQIDKEQVDTVMGFTLGGLTRLSSEKVKEKRAELLAGKKEAENWRKSPTPKVLISSLLIPSYKHAASGG
jgi:topoisomerase-4 subunit A